MESWYHNTQLNFMKWSVSFVTEKVCSSLIKWKVKFVEEMLVIFPITARHNI